MEERNGVEGEKWNRGREGGREGCLLLSCAIPTEPVKPVYPVYSQEIRTSIRLG